MRALVVVLVLARVAAADDTFEAKAAAAHRLDHVEDLVWTLTATCDKGDDVAQRQCRRVRDARAAAVAGQTFLVEGDPQAFDVGAWSPTKKSVAVKLAGCVRCGGVAIDGKTWYVANAASQRGANLYDTARVFPDEAAAKTWLESIKKVRVQLIVKPKAKWGNGVTLEIIGYRVFAACSGAIVAASPTSGTADADRKACPPAPSRTSEAT